MKTPSASAIAERQPARPRRAGRLAAADDAAMRGHQRAPHDHQQRDAHGREHRPPPRQRQQKEDVPVEQRRGPARHDLAGRRNTGCPRRRRRSPRSRVALATFGRRACRSSPASRASRPRARARRSRARRGSATDSAGRAGRDRPAREGSRRTAASTQAIATAKATTSIHRARSDDAAMHRTCLRDAAADTRRSSPARTCRMRSSTRSITSSGVDVPAVIPTVCASRNHSGARSASVWTWWTREQ